MASNTAARKPLAVADSNAIPPPKPVAAGKPAPVKVTKRKADDEPAEVSEIDSDDERLQYVNISCDAVRSKIRNFLASSEMKVGEFQKAIQTNSNTYGRFMGQNGAYKGSGSTVYNNAFVFFKKRELMGKKQPKKKVKKEDEEKKHDVTGIHIDGESDGEVPVYDTCDEVRRKIRAYLTDPNVTQAGFLRAIAQTHREGKKFQSKSLNDFMNKHGASAGNTSGVFYAAYVFFEKLRLKEGKPKSKHREEMEKIYGKSGFDIETPSNRGYWCGPGEHPKMDQYGRVSFR